MKLGFVSAILASSTFEEVVDFGSENGFKCIELACWPSGKAERRYAGVSHLDIDELNDEKVKYVKSYCQERAIEISSLAFYPNMMDSDLEKRENNIRHFLKLIEASAKLDINMVATFIGRVPDKSVEKNLQLYEEIWSPIMETAEKYKVKVAIENCPMLFTDDEWPGGQNLAVSPDIWRRMFELIPSDYLGINYDPSHFVWQQMDYISPVYEFGNKIFQVHFKDIKVLRDKLNNVGIMGTPLQYMVPKIPGLGDVDWGKYVSALTDIGYRGYACIEVEDRAFESSYSDIKNSILLAKKFIQNFVY